MKKVTSGLRTFLRTYHISIMEFPITRIYSYNRSHSSILFSSTLTFPVTIFHRLFTCHEQHEGSRSRSMIYGLSYLNTWDHLALPPLHPIFHVAFWNRLVKFSSFFPILYFSFAIVCLFCTWLTSVHYLNLKTLQNMNLVQRTKRFYIEQHILTIATPSKD